MEQLSVKVIHDVSNFLEVLMGLLLNNLLQLFSFFFNYRFKRFILMKTK